MNRLLFSLKTCQKSGAHFSENKKSACGNVPRSSGLSKIGGIFLEKKKHLWQRAQKLRASKNMGAIFLEKKKRLRQPSQPLRASKKSGTIFQKYFIQKPAKPATDLSCNGHQKIHLVQKPFRLLFPATISLKPFWTGYLNFSSHSGQVRSPLQVIPTMILGRSAGSAGSGGPPGNGAQTAARNPPTTRRGSGWRKS